MTDYSKTWPGEPVNGINIITNQCELAIIGTPDELIRVVVDSGGENLDYYLKDPQDGWLKINTCDPWLRINHMTVYLPKNKIWIVQASLGKGKVFVKEIAARFEVMSGKADVYVEACQGKFVIQGGDGKVEFSRFQEIDVPQKPPQAAEESVFPPFPGAREKNTDAASWDWMAGTAEEWASWGIEMGNRAIAWSDKIGRFFSQMGNRLTDPGIRVQVGKGDVKVNEINLTNLSLWTSKGNVQMDQSMVTNLEINSSHGDLRLRSVFPKGNWKIRTNHGDINLTLPNHCTARLDAATRQGNIRSEIPLVRVNRPGPEASHGGRMVGTIGTASGSFPEIYLVTSHGDIRIDTVFAEKDFNNMFWKKPAGNPAPSAVNPSPANLNSITGNPSTTNINAAADDRQASPAPEVITLGAAISPDGQAVVAGPQPDPALEILQSLSNGSISVEEADLLLRKLK